MRRACAAESSKTTPSSLESEYGMTVRLVVVRMPAAAREPAAAELRDLTNGRVGIEVRA